LIDQQSIAATAARETSAWSAEPRYLAIAMLAAGALLLALVVRLKWYRLERPERVIDTEAPMRRLGLAIAMFVVGPVMVYLAGDRLGGAEAPTTIDSTARLTALVYAGQLLVAGAVAVIALSGKLRGVERRAMHPLRAILWGCGALLVVWPLASAAGLMARAILMVFASAPEQPVAHETLGLMTSAPVDRSFLVLAVLVTLFAPLLEEVLYRGLIQNAVVEILRRPWVAIVLTSLFFTAMHMNNTAPHALVSLLVLSLGFGWVAQRSGSLLSSITMHALFNLGNLLAARTLVAGGPS